MHAHGAVGGRVEKRGWRKRERLGCAADVDVRTVRCREEDGDIQGFPTDPAHGVRIFSFPRDMMFLASHRFIDQRIFLPLDHTQ